MKVMKYLSYLLNFLTVVTFFALVAVVIIQITGRYTSFTFVWTEELSRYLFIFAVVFAAPLAMEKREYVRVDLALGFMPKKVRKYYDAAIYLILAVFSGLLIPHAQTFAMLGEGQTSATLGVEMYIINYSMVIVFALLALYSLMNVYILLTGKEVPEEKESVE